MSDSQMLRRRSERIAQIQEKTPILVEKKKNTPVVPKLTVSKEEKIEKFKTILQNPAFLLLEDPVQMLQMLKEQYKPYQLTKYIFEYDVWKEYVMKKIEEQKYTGLLFYLDYVLENVYGYDDVYKMDFMLEILDTLRDSHQDLLFQQKIPFIIKLKRSYYKETNWWKEHVLHSLHDEGYMFQLTQSDWLYMSDRILQNISMCSKTVIELILQSIYRNNYFEEYRFEGQKAYIDMFLQMYNKDISKEQRERIQFYLVTLIKKRDSVHPPLTFDLDTTITNNMRWYPYKTDGLYQFMLLCKEKQNADISDAIIEVLDMNREGNKEWLNLQLQYIIRPSFMRLLNHKFDVEDCKKIVIFIITLYKMNINNIYMRMRPLFSGNQPQDPIMNPKIWLDKNVPPIAWAVIYNNVDAVHFFMIYLGAKLNRCALSIQDLTTNPKILKLFNLETKVKKIQRVYKDLYYEPPPEESITKEGLTDLEQRRLTGIERRATARKAMFEQHTEAQNGGIKARSGKDKKGKKKK